MPTLEKGTIIYHGTRWKQGQEKWWKTGFPNKEGEDGGISFCLDDSSSPKITNAEVLIQYKLIKDLSYLVCKSKAEFYNVFSKQPQTIACWTKTENELAIRLVVQGAYLQYHTDSTASSCVVM